MKWFLTNNYEPEIRQSDRTMGYDRTISFRQPYAELWTGTDIHFRRDQQRPCGVLAIER